MDWLKGLLESMPGLTFVVPVSAAALAILRWCLSRHDVQFVRRKDFLSHWTDPSKLDDLSVEVLIRQLTGTYLPAVVVRRVCQQSNRESAQTLLRLSTMWPLVQWDHLTGTACWKPMANTSLARSTRRALVWLCYFASFIVGGGLLLSVATQKLTDTLAITASAWGVMLVFASVAALIRTDVWGAASEYGECMIRAANGEED